MSQGILVSSVQTPTDKEIKLVQLLSQDMRAKAIADIMNVSDRTIEAHILSTKKKYAVSTIYGLVALFMRKKLIH